MLSKKVKIVKWVCKECGSNNLSYKSTIYHCVVCNNIRTTEPIFFVDGNAIVNLKDIYNPFWGDDKVSDIVLPQPPQVENNNKDSDNILPLSPKEEKGDEDSDDYSLFPHQIEDWMFFLILFCVLIIVMGCLLVKGKIEFSYKPNNNPPESTFELNGDNSAPSTPEQVDQGIQGNESNDDSNYEDLIVDPGTVYTVRFGGNIYSIMEENDAYIMYYTSPGETLEINERLEDYWYKVTFYLAGEGIAHQGYIKIQ